MTWLALYSGLVSIGYVAIALLAPEIAAALIVPCVAALLLPQGWAHLRGRGRRRWRA